ncbi:hypothetical protein [Thermomonas carbonis]|uniref:HNH endonuclease n=1 Tax=Thermomonas carbonis TaxID=1463158 RepID=A0A7G9SLQ8_9GAMM|nr:hypothetical protein [Thermomonas carbonis]QNN68783.1 hypothetical protein H9L16_08485 [Thermomonas carbonis]GHC08816.1 hypothetical protein GCM10010080_24820 [Thermomonas carbonis]
MIRLVRGACPQSLFGESSKGGREAKEAAAAFAAGIKYDSFVAYKSKDVVHALRAMTNGKCAYCEFNYSPGGPEDVEHFRPKGAILTQAGVKLSGYYWLAAVWENLLPSCIDCNRARTHEFENQAEGVSGKANKFPIKDEQHRWVDPAVSVTEECLLLNPCEVDPSLHIEFIENGLIRPRTAANNQESILGRTTIEVLGLSRRALVQDRAFVDRMVRSFIVSAIEACDKELMTTDASEKAGWHALAVSWLTAAKAYLEPERPYLGMVRSIFNEYGITI